MKTSTIAFAALAVLAGVAAAADPTVGIKPNEVAPAPVAAAVPKPEQQLRGGAADGKKEFFGWPFFGGFGWGWSYGGWW